MDWGVLIRTSVVLYALLVTSVHIIIGLMVFILGFRVFICIYSFIQTSMYLYYCII